MSEAFDLHWDRGWEFFEAEKFEEAIAEWRKANQIDPEDGYVLNNIGRALSKLKKQEDAIVEWQEAVRLEPNYDNPHKNLAYALSASGYSSDALAAVRAALRLSPDAADLHNFLGYHLLVRANKTGDRTEWEAAAEAFRKSIALEPSYSYARRHLAQTQWYLKKGREAVQTLKDAIVANPEDAAAHIQLIRYQSYQKHYRDMYQTIVALNKLPDSEDLKQYFVDMNNLWMKVKIIFFGGVGLAAFLGLIWLQRRRG